MGFLKKTKKYVTYTALGFSFLVLIIGYVFRSPSWSNVLICIVSLFNVLLLVWQLSLYDHEDKALYAAAVALLVFYFIILFRSPKGYALTNLQNYIGAATLCVTAIQFAHDDKGNKKPALSSETKERV